MPLIFKSKQYRAKTRGSSVGKDQFDLHLYNTLKLLLNNLSEARNYDTFLEQSVE